MKNKTHIAKLLSLNIFLILALIISLSCITSVSALICNGVGGNITHDGNYCIHTFTTNGTFNTSSSITNVTILVVAGGGGGGGGNSSTGTYTMDGGGGGAGGLIYSTVNISSNTAVVVGLGGSQAVATQLQGQDGGNSSFGNLITVGGGGGSSSINAGTLYNGRNGGSGGGGCINEAGSVGGTGGTAYDSQGNNGGNGMAGAPYPSGGGGGAGVVGYAGNSTGGGFGGNGLSYSISGTSIFYAGGGGGGARNDNGGGLGGLGGGGRGADINNVATSGTNGTGSGGGGGQNTATGGLYKWGAPGGSGIIILRYLGIVPICDALIEFGNGTEPSGAILSQNFVYANVSVTEDNEVNITFTLYNETISSTCYQEQANGSTAGDGNCGLNYSGVYDFSNSFNDANWTSVVNNANNIYYWNYTKPTEVGVGNTVLKLGSYVGGLDTYYNNTYNINSSCLSSNTLQLRYNISDAGCDDICKIFSCYDGSNWITFYSTEEGMFGTPVYTEESMVWNNFDIVNQTTLGSGNRTFNWTNLIDGRYWYDVTVCDIYGLCNSTETRNITLDMTAPNATLLTPINNSYNNTDQNFTVNLTDNLAGLKNATLNIYNETGSEVNSTIFTFASDTLQSVVGVVVTLTDGVYHWFYNVFDFAGNNYTTENNTVTIDKTLPVITITYPENITYNITPSDFNYTFVELYPALCWYSRNGGTINETLTCGENLTGLESSEGSNVWMIRMQDSAGNVNQTYVTFLVDTIYPTINFTSPTEVDGSYLGANKIKINVTATDANLVNITIYLYNETKSLINFTTTTTSPNYINYTNLGDGVYFFNATAYDIVGHENSTETRNVTINTIYPQFSNQYDDSNNLTNYGVGHFNITVDNTNGTVFLNINSQNILATNLTDKVYNVSYTFTTNGTYLYNWTSYGNGNGTIHNLNTSANYNYIIGNVSINLLNPPNNTITTRTNNVTLNMSLSGNTNHNWTVTFYNATNSSVNTSIGVVTDVTTSTVGVAVSLTNLVYGQVFKWFVSITDSISTFVSNTFEFTPNNEPLLLNLRIENINLTTILVSWENEPNMEWVAFRIGNDIMEVRSITSTQDNWTVTGLFPNQQYYLEYQTGDSFHAISDYHGFFFRTLGWHPGFADYQYRRLISVNHTLVGTDKADYAVNVSLNEDNFQYFDGVNWVWYPSFLHLNYTTLNDIRFVDYYDIVELPFNVTYKNILGVGGLSYQTIPNSNYTTGTILNVDNAHDGDWSTYSVPNNEGSFYYNYTIPVGAKTTSMFRISDSGWGWDIQLPLDCYGPAGTDLAFRSDANRTGVGAGYVLTYCQNYSDGNWILARNNSEAGPYFFETMMTWQYDSQVNIEVIPRYFNDELQDNTAGIDGEYDSQFWMYYGDPDALNNESVLNYAGIDNSPLIYGPEVGPVLNDPIIYYLNDTEGRTATGTNISWSVDQIVNNRLKISTNPYILDSYFYSYVKNTTQQEHSLLGSESHVILTSTSPSEWMNIVNVTCSNSSYDNNYTINSTVNPVTITIPDLNVVEFLDWNFTYQENKTWEMQKANVVWPVRNLTTNTQYWYEAVAYGTNGNGTANGTFILGTLPSTPIISILNYSEYRPTKTVTICANLTDMNGNANIDVSFQYWNQTDLSFKETSPPTTVSSIGPVCADISVEFGELNSYRGKAVGATTGYSDSYTNEVMPIQEFFAGDTVEDNNNAPLFREYCPPNITDGTVDLTAKCYEQKGYREGSLQEETSMYVETNASTDTLTLHLYLLNGTIVSNTIMSISGYGFEYLTLNDLGENWYTFDITNSTGNTVLNWTKPGLTHRRNENRIDVSKYVSFNGTTSPFNYTLLYFNNPGVYNTSVYQWCQAAPGGNLFDCMSAQYWGTSGMSAALAGTPFDRGQFFRGGVTNGEPADSGILDYTKNSTAPMGDYRQCFAFTVYYFDESLIPSNNITNYHYVYWQENQHFSDFNGKIEPVVFHETYLFNFEYDTLTFTRDWKAYDGTNTDNRTVVKTVANTIFNSSYNQSLVIGSQNGFNVDLKNDKQYDFGIYFDGNWINQQIGKYQQGYIIFNLPDNATLSILDSDNDGINDFDEVYVYYINPKSNDTDEDGMTDGNEITGGYDPLLYNSHAASNVTLIAPANNSYHNTDQNFTADITTVSGISSIRLYINNVLTETYNTVGSVVSMTMGFVEVLSDGVYSWFYGATDNTGMSSNSTIFNVTIDKALPGIIITYPLNINYAINVSAINYTITDINPDSCWYSKDNGITNSTAQSPGTNWTGVISAEGSNTWTVYCNDSAGNINSSSVTFNKWTGTNIIDCQTLSTAGATYTQRADIINNTIVNDCIRITAVNITFNCNGYYISSIKNYTGVYSSAKNTTIKNCNITMGPIGGTGINVNTIGIELPMDSDFGILYNNTARADIGVGIRIDALNTNLTSNTGISNISNGIFITGNEYGYVSTNNIFNSNKGISNSGAAFYLFRTSNNNLTNNTGTSNSNVGIKIDNSPNTIIISNNGTSSLSQGINLYGSANSILTSNIGTSNISSGIYISTSPNATLTSNNGTSNIGQGIFLTGCSKSILTDNTGTSNADIGINVFNSNNNILIGNNGTSNIGTNNYGIYIDGTNNTLTNNIGITNTSIGIVLYTISNSTITNNIGTSTSNVGIYLYTSLNNKLTSNTGTSSDGTNAMGIYLSSSSNNNLTNNTGISNSNAGIYLLSSLNNTLTNNIGKSNTSYATYLGFSNNNILLNHNSEGYLTDSIGIVFRNGNNNIIQDCINISGISGDVLYKEAASINNTFINCTYRNTGTNESVMAGSSLIRKWYYRAYVNDTDGNSLNGANITALNVSGTTEFTGLLTNTSGLINITTITEYVNVAGIIHYYSNYTLSASLSGFPIKSHTYNVTQQLNNLNDYFTLDITIPKINIVYPISNNYTSLVTQLNYTVSDLELQSCWYSLDNGVTNTSTPCGDNVTGILSNQGYNNWTVWANDTSGNTNSSTVKFYSDSILPNATLISPLNDTYTNITTQNFTANLTDNLAIWNATLNIYNQTDNTIVNQTTQTFIEGVIQYTIGIPVYLVDGIYNWFYDIFDLAGNHAVSENRTLVIDTIFPTIEFGVGTQPNNTFINATNIYVNISVTDTNEANVTFYLYNFSSPVNQTTLGTGNRTFNWTNLANDKYLYRVIVIDKVGNQNATELRTINLDTVPPVIDLISPPTNYLTNITLNDFVANITDYIELSNLTFNIYYGNGTLRYSNFTDIYSLNIANYLMTNTINLTHGSYFWQYQAYDKTGWKTISDNRTIFVDTLPPTLTLLSPPNLAHVNSPVSFIVSITNDFSNISSATLYIYNSTGEEVNQTTTDLTALETNQTIVTTTVNLSQYGNPLENFTWRYSANDTYGHTDNSSTYQVTLDTIMPQILWTHPLAGENPWQNTTPFTIIAVASDAYLDAVNVSVFNASEEMYYNNFTQNLTTSPFIIGDTVTLQEGANRIEICARDSLTGSPEIKSISEFSKTTEKVSVFSTSAKVPEKSKTISSEMITRTIDLFQKDGKEIDAKLQNLKTTDEWIGDNHYKTTWIMDKLPEGFYIEIKLTSNKNLRLLTDRGVTRVVSNNYYFRYDDISNNGFDIKYNQISSKEVLMTVTQGKAEIKDVIILDPITGGLNNYCENQTVYLDTHAPNVTLNTPLNGTYSNITSQNLTANLTDNLGIKNTTLFVYNQTGFYNETSVTFPLNVLESTVGVVISFTDGIYHWWYQVWDWAGNTFVSPTNNTITIDTIPPGIIITYPENITYIYVPTAINYTYTELTPLNCWYSIDGGITNVSLTCGDNVTGLLANQGNNVWMIRMEDTLSNIAQTYVTFFVDSIYPEINFTAPTELNGSYLSRTNIKINVTASDTNLMNVSIKVYNSISIQVGGANWNDVVSNSFWYNFTDIDGVYYYNATVVDILGNYNQTETRMATLDTTNPLIEYGTGTAVNHANLSQSNIYVNVSWTDINFANITFTLKNLTDFVNITTYTVPGDDINWTNLPDTDYTYYVNITDLADNKNSTNIRSIRLDTHAPNATLLTPVNDTYTTVTSQNLTVNLTDNLGIKNATLFIWNQTASINQTNTNFAIDTLQTTLGIVVTLVDDAYHWWYQVWDWAGNSVTTINNTLVIDTIYPVITYANPTTPAGGPYNLTAIWSNMSAVDTNLLTISSTIELVNGVIPPYSNTQTLSPTVFPQDSLYYNWTGLSQGIYKLSGYATDKLGHTTYIVNRTINIDVDSPVISYELPTPADGLITPLNTFTINVSATDPNLANIIIYYWYLNQTVHTQTVTSYANTSINTLVQSGLSDGMYYYNASAIDTQTRISWLPTRSINVQHANQTLALCKELYIEGATYTVINNLTSVSTCLNVTAPSITVDCQGYTIKGNEAILATKPGLTLRNCKVTSPFTIALNIKGNSPASVSIYNSSFINSPYGIYSAPESNLYADLITVTGNDYGIYFNNSNNGNTLKNILMSGNVHDSITFVNSSYNSVNNLVIPDAVDVENNGVIVFNTSTDNKFDGCNITAGNPKIWGLYDYSINNLLHSCYYPSDTQDYVDGTSHLIRSWPFTGKVVDKVLNKMSGAVITFTASIPTNKNVTYKYSGINITYGTLGGMTITNDVALAYTNVTQYMNIFGTEYVSTPYYFNASYNIFTPTIALLNINDSDISRYHLFILGNEIRSTSLSRTAMWIILGIIFLIGLAASIGFFMVRMREGYSVVDIWKYFIILVIWLTIFTIIYFVLAWFIMGSFYPQV